MLDAARGEFGDIRPDNAYSGQIEAGADVVHVALDELDVPIYSVDSVVRRSEPLQRTVFARGAEREEERRDEVSVQSAG